MEDSEVQHDRSFSLFPESDITSIGGVMSDDLHDQGRSDAEKSLTCGQSVNSFKAGEMHDGQDYFYIHSDCREKKDDLTELYLHNEKTLSAPDTENSPICGHMSQVSNTNVQNTNGLVIELQGQAMAICSSSSSNSSELGYPDHIEKSSFHYITNNNAETSSCNHPLSSEHNSLQLSNESSSKNSLLSLLKEKQELLDLLKNQNGVRGSEIIEGVPNCKILTKYVFISKPHHRPKKKKFGVPYRKAFRHFYKSKLQTKTQCAKFSKPHEHSTSNVIRKTGPKTGRKLSSKGKEAEKEGCNKVNIDNAKPHPDNKSKTANSKRRILSLSQKVEIIKTMDNSDSSLLSVAKQYGISRTVLWRILKRKEDIIARYEAGEALSRKKRKESLETEKRPEKTDSEGESAIHEDDKWLNSGFPSKKRKSKFRNRKDLTLEEKVKVIQALESPGTKINAMAKKFGVSVSSISRINKNKDFIMLKSSSGDLSSKSKRSRECKDPELDRVLLKWYRAIEKLKPEKKISISNVLLKQKAHDLALVLGKNYFPSDNWIIRWKQRHNLMSKVNIIQDKAELQRLDSINVADILEEAGKHQVFMDQVKRENELRHGEKPEQFFICEHCGVLTSNRKKKENQHLSGCPASAIRKDLTLEEKVQVVHALEEPGVKMIHLAKRYGVSASAISRIAKNRVDILARKASGLSNSQRKRDRGSKEPEVEKALCEWFRVQHEMGIHISGSMIREKARDIAQVMGKEFWPSESWVFRWRQRNNVSDMNAVLYADSEEGEDNGDEPLERRSLKLEDGHNTDDGILDIKVSFGEEITTERICKEDPTQKEKTKIDDQGERKSKLPRSVMCEKCGFVSSRVKNSRMKSLRHAKGCPDMKPRHELTYETRAKMLKALEEPGATLSSVARQFGVSVSSMSRINANKERILNHCLDHSGQKRIRFCKEPEVAQSLYQWYLDRKAEGVHVTGPKLKEVARKIAAEMGRDFKASSGWLGRWRHRYNIVGSIRAGDKISGGLSKKKKQKKMTPERCEDINHMVPFQPMVPEMPQDSLGSSAGILVEPNEVQQPPQQTQQAPVFLHQRFSTPWEMTQQQTSSCVWAKDFLSPSTIGGQEDGGIPVTYAYTDSVQKPVFHNAFETFPNISYQVAMPVEPGLLPRDFLKTDNSEDKVAGAGNGLISHAGHANSLHHMLHLPANISTPSHLQHHMVTNQAHSQQPLSKGPPQHSHLPSHPMPPPSPSIAEDDPEQQRQVMEAFKIMNSFVQKKSLGDHVQTALRTIEMTMRNQSRKPPSRNTYTSI